MIAHLQYGLDDVKVLAFALGIDQRHPVNVLQTGEQVQHLRRRLGHVWR